MSVETSIVSVVTFFLLALSIAIFFRGERDQLNRSYSFFVLMVALWGLGIAGFLFVTEKNSLELWARYLYAFGASTAPAFYYFALAFPTSQNKIPTISRARKLSIFIPGLAIFGLIFLTDFLISGVTFEDANRRGFLYGPASHLIDLHVWGFFSLALVVFLRKLLASSGIQRNQLIYANLGTYLSLSIINVTNIILPSFFHEFRFLWVGPTATIILVILLAYAITKHHLFDIKVAIVEILSTLLSAVLFINMLIAEEASQIAWRGGLFVAVVVLSYLLVRQVLNEIKQREELQHAYAKLKELDEAKSEFVSIASHQLRTPLTAIKGYMSMILEGSYGNLNETQHKPMQSVYESNERLIRLVNDLLNISRIESGRVDMKWAKKNIADIIQGAIDEIGIKAQEKKLKLIFEKPEESLPEISLDEEKIRNVLLNILDNAIRYTKAGKITIKTHLKEEYPKGGKSVVVEVKDTGDGMTQEELNHLFESFSRGGAGTRMSTEGAGLGLYIAKQFVNLHKGKIWAESQGRGEGSTFFVELPIQ